MVKRNFTNIQVVRKEIWIFIVKENKEHRFDIHWWTLNWLSISVNSCAKIVLIPPNNDDTGRPLHNCPPSWDGFIFDTRAQWTIRSLFTIPYPHRPTDFWLIPQPSGHFALCTSCHPHIHVLLAIYCLKPRGRFTASRSYYHCNDTTSTVW